MIARRSFLIGAGSIAIAQLLTGCGAEQSALVVGFLAGSIPPQLLGKFRQQLTQGEKLRFEGATKLLDLFTLLLTWREQEGERETGGKGNIPFTQNITPIADLVTVGNYWLTEAIQKQLIQPLEVKALPSWENLPALWQKLVLRNERGELAANGSVWGAPYRTGATVIAYRTDKLEQLGWTPTDWNALWREELRGRFSLLDHPREVIGLTLKKLGHGYNTHDLAAVPELRSALIKLNQQVKFYSSDNYLQPLILGDTWLAVGWQTDIVPLLKSYPEIKMVVPQSGTSLWADIWVKPKLANADNIRSPEWIDFCWQPESASLISLFTDAASPVIFGLEPGELSQDLLSKSEILLSAEIIEKSDFILPLPLDVEQKYNSLWKEIRMVNG
ncbi:MAG: extracellular solute-binding protein [Gomphosphaeria aponina SAG 52.96 = DSM 107014]|uniref:Extracellular solute-binding protein n=1 Tax=Gomphosphaeria aponina SAG 52.96 = DSM 107014 TaxID=1521640 RepID=A0A941JL99_9CHRO|nr:extracellular solute-binding protein [Gomphosphaeria aponina SAG 52.96 = DSM 107014]